jgi:tRNA-Thr(GGU) m(6)t(6)A37 methyltransferase TsaA
MSLLSRNSSASVLTLGAFAGSLVLAAVAAHAYQKRQTSNRKQSSCDDSRNNSSSSHHKNKKKSKKKNTDTSSSSNDTKKNTRRATLQDGMTNGSLTMQSIGTVHSIYRLCVGTPRQGLLAPHARGRILLDSLNVGAALDAVDGLEHFSHIWVVFVFHLNTLSKKTSSKIAPPALGGRKVGVLATRSPHRFNPVGITLVRLNGIRTVRRGDSMVACLDISGLDLVDGTPVLDIKPYVGTYDAPGAACFVPSWVSGGLATKRTVEFSETACRSLKDSLTSVDFYGTAAGETADEGYDNLKECITEVLSMDVRSPYQTKKARQGKSQAERAQHLQEQNQKNRVQLSPAVPPPEAKDESVATPVSPSSSSCTQQIDNLLVHFDVRQAASVQRTTSQGSGAEDHVVVTSIEVLVPAKEAST